MERQKKKILMFHPSLAPYRIDQFNSLNELFDLTVVFLFDNIWNNNMDQERLLSQCSFKISYLLKGPSRKGKILFRFGMYRMIKKLQPDIVMGFEYSPTTQLLLLWRRLGLITQKVGTTLDDSIDMCYHMKSEIRCLARKYSARYLDFWVVMSDEVSQFYQDQFKVNEQQLIVSPILQKPERLRENAQILETAARQYVEEHSLYGKKVLLFVGRLIPEKGLSGFLNTLSPLLRETADLKFVIIGEGKEFSLLQTIVEEQQLHGKVIFAGRLEGEELHAWYTCGSGLVLPSLFEPFGAVVNEALIFGMPVICSEYAGASSLMISPDQGIVFDPKDAKDTLAKTKLFLKSIRPIEEVSLAAKPSLMGDYQLKFNKEWGKLA